ncbi:MAG: patatin family protein [Erysipelotrichales bacterium]|nr:patatin family protein [Erysipelotrichales bacterium]
MIQDKKRSILVLEGGAMRGLFTAGVLDVMMDHGLEFDEVIGVSAGATFGVNYVSRQKGRTIRYNKRFAKDPRYCSIRSLITTGDLYGGEFCYHVLPAELDIFDEKTFVDNPCVFTVVATDVKTGKPVYHTVPDMSYESLEWVRASATMPMLGKPVKIRGGSYVDGGAADSIPLDYALNRGYEKIVIVLTQPLAYRKGKMTRIPGFHALYPAVAKAMDERPEKYNEVLDRIMRLEKAGRVFAVRPPGNLPVGKIEHDPAKMQEAYDIGRKTAEEIVGGMETYLNEKEDR